tara:strand:+ start:2916 stop:4532 length:1617 start_codon:yes stop_codon:yes gene_type:complete
MAGGEFIAQLAAGLTRAFTNPEDYQNKVVKPGELLPGITEDAQLGKYYNANGEVVDPTKAVARSTMFYDKEGNAVDKPFTTPSGWQRMFNPAVAGEINEANKNWAMEEPLKQKALASTINAASSSFNLLPAAVQETWLNQYGNNQAAAARAWAQAHPTGSGVTPQIGVDEGASLIGIGSGSISTTAATERAKKAADLLNAQRAERRGVLVNDWLDADTVNKFTQATKLDPVTTANAIADAEHKGIVLKDQQQLEDYVRKYQLGMAKVEADNVDVLGQTRQNDIYRGLVEGQYGTGLYSNLYNRDPNTGGVSYARVRNPLAPTMAETIAAKTGDRSGTTMTLKNGRKITVPEVVNSGTVSIGNPVTRSANAYDATLNNPATTEGNVLLQAAKDKLVNGLVPGTENNADTTPPPMPLFTPDETAAALTPQNIGKGSGWLSKLTSPIGNAAVNYAIPEAANYVGNTGTAIRNALASALGGYYTPYAPSITAPESYLNMNRYGQAGPIRKEDIKAKKEELKQRKEQIKREEEYIKRKALANQ